MSMTTVRDLLIKQLKELSDSDASKEEVALSVEKAKASSIVANSYIQAVKTELDAVRVMYDTGYKVESVELVDPKTVNSQSNGLRLVNGK